MKNVIIETAVILICIIAIVTWKLVDLNKSSSKVAVQNEVVSAK